ncbi:Ankyrin repeat domain-containing protein [Tetrabaena socialis]|uniref:Ankyrin repeat domain-containing protein n=1 Tax=Tetrabaena socialis TaxID=47790 RepID=A0A2J8A8Y3_9CHLO|nr:Ankyrin repeat domain-containing protein [Tetrabaena socialis]|eukprot:PNH08979.1 Ankyrin repeat domain-containing protein [Tetrabaena socialis]
MLLLFASRAAFQSGPGHWPAAAAGCLFLQRALMRQLAAPQPRGQQRVGPSSAAAGGGDTPAVQPGRPERLSGRAAELSELATAAVAVAVSNPTFLGPLRPSLPDPAGEVALLRAELAVLQAARVRELEARETAAQAAAANAHKQAAAAREELAAAMAQQEARRVAELEAQVAQGAQQLRAAQQAAADAQEQAQRTQRQAGRETEVAGVAVRLRELEVAMAQQQASARETAVLVQQLLGAAETARGQLATVNAKLAAGNAQLQGGTPLDPSKREPPTPPAEHKDLSARPPRTRDEWALLEAAQRGSLRDVERLLRDHTANPNVRDKDNWTALIRASKEGRKDVVGALCGRERTYMSRPIAETFDICYPTALNRSRSRLQYDWTALHAASMEGHTAVVEALLRAGADKDTKNHDGWTALQRASGEGHMAVVLALLRVGADKDAQNTFGWTALHEASKEGHAAVVEALLMAGADNEIKNDRRSGGAFGG